MTGFYLQGPRFESVFAVTLVVLTSVFSFVRSSAQEVFYRVHADEYELIKDHLRNYPNGFLIVSPDKKMAMPHILAASGSKTVLEGVPVDISDDGETITVDDVENSNILYELTLPKGSSYVNLQYSRDGSIMHIYNKGENAFYSEKETNDAVDKRFRIKYNSSDDALLEIVTPEKDGKTYHIIYGDTPTTSTERFRMRDDMTDKELSIYHRDCFNIHIIGQDESRADSYVKIGLDIAGLVAGVETRLSYVQNNGAEVGIAELVGSPDYEVIYADDAVRSAASASIPVRDGCNTIWAMPVMMEGDVAYPAGRIFKGNINSASSGIAGVGEDEDDSTPVYFDLYGRKVSQPMSRGVYVRRVGSKVSKIIVE